MNSTNQMAIVPCELLEQALDAAAAVGMEDVVDELNRILTPRAEQHQGELGSYPPCDYCGVTPDYHPWHGSGLLNGVENRHIHACDDCRGKLPAHLGQHQVEPVAYAVFADNGNIRIWSTNCEAVSIKVMQEEGKQAVPLYTHADAGEIERLREENQLLKEGCDAYENIIADLVSARDAYAQNAIDLRAQLVERDALLREIAERHWSGVDFDLPADLATRIKALSASAEPSAPVTRAEQPSGTQGATTRRPPLGRSPTDEDRMNLPEGKTCGDCAHARRCTTMFGHIPEDESCDWSPSRFQHTTKESKA